MSEALTLSASSQRTTELKAIAANIFFLYDTIYNGEIQGCCPLIADDIQKLAGGEVVAGEITLLGGSIRRTHWWVETEGIILDPMGDNLMSHPDDFRERVEIHRNREIFEKILPAYERWRI